MKAKCSILICFLFLFIKYSCNSQETIEKVLLNSKSFSGGDVLLKKSIIKSDGSKSYKMFEVESPSDGDYYLNMWLMGYELENFGSGKFQEYDLTINNDKLDDKIKPEKQSWHNLAFKGITKEKATVRLKEGLNQITFSCNAPAMPEIEFIRLSKDKTISEITDTNYNTFVDDIRNEMQERIKYPIIERDSSATISKAETNLTKGTSALLDNPDGNYYYHLDATYKYTFYTPLYFSAGLQIFFTTQSNSFLHVLEVFSQNYTETYSWVATSNPSGVATININIPVSDFYIIRIRSWNQAQQGLVNLNVWDAFYFADCVASGWAGFRNPHETPTTYNYFTGNITGDTRIWIEDDSGMPGRIRGWNDDYYVDGSFDWGLASRVKNDFSMRIAGALVSSFSSYTPEGTYDLYVKCMNSTIMYFPQLTADDAIQSAPISSNYNCASWGGGRIDLGRYFWASNPPTSVNLSSPWYVAGDFWASWDNFFGNNPLRFTGAPNYTSAGADEINGEIAMWYNSTPGSYTHFSVRRPANEQPHGYDWESKPGGDMRIFHPRDALNDNTYYGYGSIDLYYKRADSGLKSYTFAESVARGLTVSPVINLTAEESNKIYNLRGQLISSDITEFNIKFEELVKKSQSPAFLSQSNPVFLYETLEFKDLKKYCKNKGQKIWPLLFEKVFDEKSDISNELAAIIVNEITPQSGSLMEQVKEEWRNNCYTDDGAYIAPSPMANTKNYIKKLLNLSDQKDNIESNSKSAEEGMVDNNDIFTLYPNPFKTKTNVTLFLRYESNITLKVYDMNGNLLSTVINNQKLPSGKHTIEWIPNNLKSGLYVFNLNLNGKTFSRRFLIE
jgi:hypothetical protein